MTLIKWHSVYDGVKKMNSLAIYTHQYPLIHLFSIWKIKEAAHMNSLCVYKK